MEYATYLPVVLAAFFMLLFALERYLPLRRPHRSLWRRLLVNMTVSTIALAVGAALIRPAIASIWNTNASQIGLLNWLNLPPSLNAVVGFVFMDLSFYYWHRANHQLPVLWRFHNVHHIDPDLDVSTAFRFHFGEMVLSAGFRVVQVLVLGVGPVTYLIYEAVFQANTIFHHSNTRLPIALERLLNRLLVTPRMHGIHHSQKKSETNSNYSVVFPWWDWLHQTLCLNVPQSSIQIGVPAYCEPEDNHLRNVLLMPFRRQRDYWGHSGAEQDGGEPLDHATKTNARPAEVLAE